MAVNGKKLKLYEKQFGLDESNAPAVDYAAAAREAILEKLANDPELTVINIELDDNKEAEENEVCVIIIN